MLKSSLEHFVTYGQDPVRVTNTITYEFKKCLQIAANTLLEYKTNYAANALYSPIPITGCNSNN